MNVYSGTLCIKTYSINDTVVQAATTNYVKVQTANYILNKFMLGNLVPIKYLLSVLENKFE